MCIELFVGRHDFDGRSDGTHALRQYLLKSNLANEAVEAHSAICLGVSVGRQGVIGARRIVATLSGESGPRNTEPALVTCSANWW